jgi:ribosomal protein S12 methylthiotransferase
LAKVSLVSLGCPKNLVDSEGALGEIVGAGHEIVTDNSLADVVVVNTCGFVESARQESIEAICDALAYKQAGSCKAVVVIGCLSQRFGDELCDELVEVDAFLGIGHAGKLADTIDRALAGERTHDAACPTGQWIEPDARVQSTPAWTAYLKISDGCSNRCAYCAIPDIRGPYRSRPENLILDEARRLADSGVREVILIGQDLTQYGEDYGKPNSLAGLIRKLNEIEALRWIRLMYCYPTKVTPELIDAIAECEKVVKYVDLPLQHADDGILRAMNRRGSADEYIRVIDDMRAKIPEIALRTTFIVGFPGETEAAFENLMRFVERIRFDRVGAFTYSREEGTPAADLSKRVPRKVAAARYDRLMRLQQAISLERNRSFVGKKMEVLVEGAAQTGMFGRSYRDAPEIDGLVYLPSSSAEPGTFVEATIADATEYDLIGR